MLCPLLPWPPLCSSRHIRPIKTSRLSCPLGILNFDIDTHNVTVFERRSYCCSVTKLSAACDWSIRSNESQFSQSQAADSLVRGCNTTVVQTLNVVYILWWWKHYSSCLHTKLAHLSVKISEDLLTDIPTLCLAKIRCIRCLEVQEWWIGFSIINKEKLPSLNTMSSHGSINVNIEAAYCPLSHHQHDTVTMLPPAPDMFHPAHKP